MAAAVVYTSIETSYQTLTDRQTLSGTQDTALSYISVMHAAINQLLYIQTLMDMVGCKAKMPVWAANPGTEAVNLALYNYSCEIEVYMAA